MSFILGFNNIFSEILIFTLNALKALALENANVKSKDNLAF